MHGCIVAHYGWSHITDAQHNQLTTCYLLPGADTILHLYASSLLIFLRYMLLIVPESAEIHKEHLI